eukprot:TRINITY_DN5949_c0_g1_i1.p1 TRINITY_DN5949_c0_g1~~TRINITY_DN5949_c0_g1_i1.p1  ORF type:complete len:757 (+),score=176.94 TRINITY_DN5949_c0_g1_i1:117-2387(+)
MEEHKTRTMASTSTKSTHPSVITNDLRQPYIPFEEGWNRIESEGIKRLQRIIQDNLSESFSNKQYVDLYTIIYQMCIQKPSCTVQLYDHFRSSITSYLEGVALPAIISKRGPYLVRELVKRWNDHVIMKRWMSDFFRYLNRYYVKRASKKPLEEIAVICFHDVIYEQSKAKMTTEILSLIQQDRDGEEVDTDLLREAINIYVEMGMGTDKVYQRDFNDPFIAATASYYFREVTNWAASDSCPDFLRKAEVRLTKEKKILTTYLQKPSEEPLLDVFYHAVLLRHQQQVLEKSNTGVKALLKNNAVEDLSRMYALYSCVPNSLKPIAQIFHSHLLDLGNALVEKISKQEKTTEYIPELMNIHEASHELVVQCFHGNHVFHKALKEAFENLINKSAFQTTTSELLAEYADSLLAKGSASSTLTEKAIEIQLNNVVQLFAYLRDKDLYAEIYRNLLSKRLLLGRSASTDAEKSMIGRLKLRCGAQFTSKLEGMLNDMRAATEHNNSFKDYCRDKKLSTGDIEFSMQVLTTGFWPSYKAENLILPEDMNTCIDHFKHYYESKTSNRVLTWMHHLGSITVAGYFSRTRVDLVMTPIQAIILLAFNKQNEYRIADLIQATGMSEESMKKQLRCLVGTNCKILVKRPSEGYDSKHIIGVNQSFTSAQRRIRVPAAVTKTTQKERDKTAETVQEDRKYAIEACIVRIMKARKTLTHQQLMAEVTSQLMQLFRPDPKIIKRRIEDLIQREYLERDEQKNNVYRYLA